MAMIVRAAQPQTATGMRRDPRHAAHARLSGAISSSAACNPADLTTEPFSRVSHIDFESSSNVRVVQFTRVDDDDLDW